jgi:glycine hydroxymethyltransferase
MPTSSPPPPTRPARAARGGHPDHRPGPAKKLDKAVFPGEQGGPHVTSFAALALTFKLAQTKQFEKLQKQTIKNAQAMSERFKERGLRVPFGGTNCHMLNLDCRTIKGPDGTSLSGDQAARILDLVGIVLNRNTIPGDKSPRPQPASAWARPGSPSAASTRKSPASWPTSSRTCCWPVRRTAWIRRQGTAAARQAGLRDVEHCPSEVRALAESAGIDFKPTEHGYPHFYYIDDKTTTGVFDLSGERVRQFLDYAVSSDLSALKPGNPRPPGWPPPGEITGTLTCVTPGRLPPVRTARTGRPGCHLAAGPLGWLRFVQPGWKTGLFAAPAARPDRGGIVINGL